MKAVLRIGVLGIVLMLGDIAGAQCPGDCNADAEVTIDELVAAVDAALSGCPSEDGSSGPTVRRCGPRGIITEPVAFRPSPSAPTNLDGVLQLNDSVYMVPGFGNTFMVVTDEGNVIIDTSIFLSANGHKTALQAIDDGPVKYIILTHAHADHIGGVPLWKQPDTEVLAQRNQVDFLHYERRLAPLFSRRNLSQFSVLFNISMLPPFAPPDAPVENFGGQPLATKFVDTFYEFTLGGLTFQMLHTPGETPDHMTVWIPEYKIAFSGDNYYISFPNLYTLRGTEPRKALDYVNSLNTVMSWNPEILAPSHGNPIYGRQAIQDALGGYRDAILEVHDKTVQGMNAGKDVFTLMREVELPPDFEHNEFYGKVPWSVRGIYEGYIGWFDGNVSNMYETPARAIYPEVVEMAGGVDAIAARAAALVEAEDFHRAMHMADMALEANPENVAALQAKRDAVNMLFQRSMNLNESGWLKAALIEIDARLAELSE